MASKVFFSREITPEKVVEMYQLAGKELSGKVAVKLHSGEEGNQNFLRPEFWKKILLMPFSVLPFVTLLFTVVDLFRLMPQTFLLLFLLLYH